MSFLLSKKLMLIAVACLSNGPDDAKLEEVRNRVVQQYNHCHAEKYFGIKKTSFEISNEGFLRYRTTDEQNKSAYYSVKLSKLKEAVYLGDEQVGWLVLKFVDDSVIYQTYNDKTGNVDEMLTEIRIPVQEISLTQIDLWCKAFELLKH